MTPQERRLWLAVQRRASTMTPDLATRILTAFQTLRDSLTDAEMARLIDSGQAERVVQALVEDARFNAAMQPVRDTIRRNILQNVSYYVKALPIPAATSKAIGIAFDYLSPNVVTAIRQLETRTLNALQESTKETLRAFVEQGLRSQLTPRAMVKDIRALFGLSPSQAQEVLNFRDALMGVNGRNVTDYSLRNRAVDRLLAKGPLTPEQVERYTEIYRKRRIAQNAYTNAKTAASDAQKLGNRLAWQAAIDSGIVDPNRLKHQWIGVMDERERPEHIAMEKEIQPYDQPYSNGQLVPGETDYNCRCLDRFFVSAA